MDSLQRFSIERLTSPSHVPSSKTHSGWNGLPSSSIYPMPVYGHTATSADKTYPWNSDHTHSVNSLTKHYKDVDPAKKLQDINDAFVHTSKNSRQIADELKSPISNNVPSEYDKTYYNLKQKAHSRPDDRSSREIQDGGHLGAKGGKRLCSLQDERNVDVDECEKSGNKERRSSECQENGEEAGDGSGKPEHSYIAMISMSILASPERKLVLSDIYQYIMDNFQYYNNQERAWRNSIRHNLSLNECFIKAGRAENGKGNYWAIHPACVEDFAKGDYRRRHARRRARGGPYSDINVSTLPYNYRCNLGYVPMTPTSAIGYPYPLSYIHGLPSPASAASLLRGSETISNATAISSAIRPTMPPPTTTTTTKGDRNHVSGFSVKESSAGQDFNKHLTGLSTSMSLSSSKTAGLLPQTYLPNMLSPSLRYSPYGFPFF